MVIPWITVLLELPPPIIRNGYRLNFEFLVLGLVCNMVLTPTMVVYCNRRKRKKVRDVRKTTTCEHPIDGTHNWPALPINGFTVFPSYPL